MSADKYAQFIAEQQRALSVSGTNAVNLSEKKHLSDKQKKIAAQAGDPDEIEGEDFEALRAKKHMKKEEVEQIDDSELAQIEEAVKHGKGIKDMLDHHLSGMKIAKSMIIHHQKMADSSEHQGDDDGWHYHIQRAADHLFDHERHKSKHDRIVSLAAKAKEHGEKQAAREVLDKRL